MFVRYSIFFTVTECFIAYPKCVTQCNIIPPIPKKHQIGKTYHLFPFNFGHYFDKMRLEIFSKIW